MLRSFTIALLLATLGSGLLTPVWAQAPTAPAQTEETPPPAAPSKAEVLDPASSPFAQVQRENEAEEKERKKSPRRRKFLTMTLGVEYDEKLPPLPPVVTFKGDYKRIVSAMLAKDINSLRFNPVHEGVGTLTVHDSKGRVVAEYRIEVRKNRLDTVMREMQSLMGDIEGISLKIVNNKVVVDGQVLTPRDMNRIYNIVSQYGDSIATSIVTMSPLAQKKIAEIIARDIDNPDIIVRSVNDKIILQGVAKSPEEHTRALSIAKLYVPPVILDKAEADGVIKKQKVTNDGVVDMLTEAPPLTAPPDKIIQLIIHYVELTKDYEKSFRFQFMPGIKDDSGIQFSTSSGSDTTISGTISNLLPKLNWAKEHGYGRVLESTSLIVKDNKKGVLNSFQEIPYQTAQGQNGAPTTSFKKVGMQTSITPQVIGERSDSINLTIEFEISALAGLTAAGPTTSSNQMQTEIVVRSGQSAAIGGLITNRSNTGYNKLPADANPNPIISLYASRQFQRNQSQFVVFITPIIKSSASAGSEKIKKKFRLHD